MRILSSTSMVEVDDIDFCTVCGEVGLLTSCQEMGVCVDCAYDWGWVIACPLEDDYEDYS